MIVVKFQNESGEYVSLNNIKSVRFTLHNKSSSTKNVTSDGWIHYKNNTGDKYAVINLQGLCSSNGESIMRKSALESKLVHCEIIFLKNSQEKVSTRCSILRYEKRCEAGKLESYTAILVSSGEILYQPKHSNAV